MERNTLTTLGELQAGDVFTYAGRADPWHVVEKDQKNKKVFVNQFLPWGVQIHRHHDEKKAGTQVRFLRHKTEEGP